MTDVEFADIRTFGTVIRFALDLEVASAEFYGEAKSKGVVKGSTADLFETFAEEHQKRKALLEHTRREKLNEMILEPIIGVDTNKYKPNLKAIEELDEKEALAQAIELEEKSSIFYSDIAVESETLLAEAARILGQMGKQNLENISKLKAI